ncbi:MAG: 23S rRNA (pseudouridine(1915)-N(3))-methyltransferase RlmH [Gammaproteobacteria bacterium]
MQIDLIAVGKRMPDWIESACSEYLKRLPKQVQLSVLEINPANRTRKNSVDNFKQQEEQRILEAIKPDSMLIVLDEGGQPVSSKGLANKLGTWIDNQQAVSVVIGGADGLSERLKNDANETWSLSGLTLPHGLVRVLFVEQVYRAWSILDNHPYHRE